MTRSDEVRAHWDRKIARWDASAYGDETRRSVMDHLRRSLDARLSTALAILRPHIAGKTLLDLGCGTGRLAVEAVASLGAARAHGIDLSPVAVEHARALAEAAGVADRVTFEAGTVARDTLPAADVTAGLGLLDWLNDAETDALLAALRGRKYLLSHSAQDGSLAEIVHRVYLVYRLRLFGGAVRARHHRWRELLDVLRRHDLVPCEIVSNRAMRFGRIVHNLADVVVPTPRAKSETP